MRSFQRNKLPLGVLFLLQCYGCSPSYVQSSLREGDLCYWCLLTDNETENTCLPISRNDTLPIEVEAECPNLNFYVGNCDCEFLF